MRREYGTVHETRVRYRARDMGGIHVDTSCLIVNMDVPIDGIDIMTP